MFLTAANRNIDSAVNIINQLTNNSMFAVLREELFCSIVSAIHSIADYEERIRSQLSEEDDQFLRAFLYINNQLKHDKKLEMFYSRIAGSRYPMSYPYKYGTPSVRWKNFPDNSHPARGKREHYEKYLMDKDIAATLMQVKSIINNHCDK